MLKSRTKGLKIFSTIHRGGDLTDRKGEGREHIGTTVVSHFILVHAASASKHHYIYTPLWEFGSGGPGSHGVALLSHSRVSSFVCNSFAGCTAHAHRAPARAQDVCASHTPTNRTYEYRGLVWVSRRKRGREENERTGEARISPCKANLYRNGISP